MFGGLAATNLDESVCATAALALAWLVALILLATTLLLAIA
jgi:hypothetical protein